MKQANFISYMLEREQRTYDFKIKIADIEPTDDFLDRIEHGLSAFEVASISKPKHIITGAASLDFPNLGHCDVYLIKVSVKYPCTDQQMRSTVSYQSRIPMANVVVVPANQPEEMMRDESVDDDTEKKQKTADDGHIGQQLVGQKRLETLRDLETRKYEFASPDVKVTKIKKDTSKQQNSSPVTGAKLPKGLKAK